MSQLFWPEIGLQVPHLGFGGIAVEMARVAERRVRRMVVVDFMMRVWGAQLCEALFVYRLKGGLVGLIGCLDLI